MKTHRVVLNRVGQAGRVARSSVGGYPVLAADQEWPLCGLCGARQVLFFQLDLPARLGLPFEDGSHLAVFACAVHKAPPASPPPAARLPAEYLRPGGGHYRLVLNRPAASERVLELEPRLVHLEIALTAEVETLEREGPGAGYDVGSEGFKAGGVPSWAGPPERRQCACGAEMGFLCQVPLDYGFLKSPAAPPQPDAPSPAHYTLFEGSELYVFACAAQCSPYAVWPIARE